VPDLLVQDAYFQSFYQHYAFPNEDVFQRVADECLSGISIVYRSSYDSLGSIYGWTIFSTSSSEVLNTGVVSQGCVSDVSSMRRTELESLLLVFNLLRCILQRFL
jgi:hypothetical protein